MAKLWLTDKAYPLWAYIIRITYWLVIIYLSSIYVQYYEQESWFKVGLMVLSLLCVIVFLGVGRYLDHFFKIKKK